MSRHRVSVVILAYGAEDWLHAAVATTLASRGVDDLELIVVDNGCTCDAVATLAPDPRLRVLTPSQNTGFAGGINLGFTAARGDILVMLNSDAEVQPVTMARLVTAIDEGADLAGAVILLAGTEERVNSAGNPLHVLGLAWAGHLDEPRASLDLSQEAACLSGACLALRADAWRRLGGFSDAYFAYHEDVDLCWRARQQGMRLELVPEAVAWHHYEFGRNPRKMYLMERNRLIFVLTTYQRSTLLVLALPLLAFEGALMVMAWRQGWAREKARGWGWILTHRGYLARRRRQVQVCRILPDRALYPYLTTVFDARQVPLPRYGRPLQRVLGVWWRLGTRLVGGSQ